LAIAGLVEGIRNRGVWIVSIVFLSTAVAVGTGQYAFGLFIEPLEAEFGWSRTAISASLSFAALSSLAAPFIGRWMDRYGARPILCCSLAIMSISFLLRPFMSELWQWYALSMLQFIAFAGASNLPTGKMVGVWFPKTRGRVMGIAAIGNNFGGLVMPPIIAATLIYASWQASYIVVGLLGVFLVIVATFVMREFPGEVVSGPKAQGAGGAVSAGPVLTGQSTREALRTPAFYVVYVVATLGYFTYSTLLPHVYVHLTQAGLSVAAASFSLSTLAIGGMFGKLVFGFMAEKIGTRTAIVVNLLGQALFATVVSIFVAGWALKLLCPVLGLFIGGFGVLLTLLIQDIYGMRNFGAIMGLITTGGVISFGLGPILAGVSFDWTGNYATAFFTVAGMFVSAALLLLFAPMPRPEFK